MTAKTLEHNQNLESLSLEGEREGGREHTTRFGGSGAGGGGGT